MDWVIVEYFLLGIVLGGVGGVFGIGGGLLAIPALVWLGMPQAMAQGTALVMIAPNVLLGFIRYKQRNPIELETGAVLGCCALVTSYCAARLVIGLPSATLQGIFAVFLVVLAFLVFNSGRGLSAESKSVVLPPVWLPALGVVSGICAGVFTVGGGLVVVPALIRWFGVKKQTIAQGLGLATVVPGSFASLYAYSAAGKVDWHIGVPLACGGILSISYGVALAHALPERLLRLAFCGLLCTTAVMLW